MLMAYFFLGLGLLLIFLEFFLPGGVMGTAGAFLFGFSILYYAIKSESLLHVALFTIGAIIALFIVIKLALARVKAGDPDSSVFLSTDQEGFHAPQFDEALIGLEGKALTDLRPSGKVLISGKQKQAIAKTGYIEKGAAISVSGGKSGYLIVKLSKKENE